MPSVTALKTRCCVGSGANAAGHSEAARVQILRAATRTAGKDSNTRSGEVSCHH